MTISKVKQANVNICFTYMPMNVYHVCILYLSMVFSYDVIIRLWTYIENYVHLNVLRLCQVRL